MAKVGVGHCEFLVTKRKRLNLCMQYTEAPSKYTLQNRGEFWMVMGMKRMVIVRMVMVKKGDSKNGDCKEG